MGYTSRDMDLIDVCSAQLFVLVRLLGIVVVGLDVEESFSSFGIGVPRTASPYPIPASVSGFLATDEAETGEAVAYDVIAAVAQGDVGFAFRA